MDKKHLKEHYDGSKSFLIPTYRDRNWKETTQWSRRCQALFSGENTINELKGCQQQTCTKSTPISTTSGEWRLYRFIT